MAWKSTQNGEYRLTNAFSLFIEVCKSNRQTDGQTDGRTDRIAVLRHNMQYRRWIKRRRLDRRTTSYQRRTGLLGTTKDRL